MPSETTVSVDLGKSRCRLFLDVDGAWILRDGPGTPGLAAEDGAEQAADAILPLLEDALADTTSVVVRRIGVGAAGALVARKAAAQLATILGDSTKAEVAVTSDVVAAHAGAFAGEAGVLVVAGTGAVALGISGDGARQADGWGPDLGDLGGGSWLGREAVRAVLRARDGIGPETELTKALAAHIGSGVSPVAWLAADAMTARRIATVAPLLLDAADTGDVASVAIRDEGARLLAESAQAAAGTLRAVCLHGGLVEHAGYHSAISDALAERGLDVLPSLNDSLSGAAAIAERRAPLHEEFTHRVG